MTSLDDAKRFLSQKGKIIAFTTLLAGATAWAETPFGIATIAGTPYDPSGDGGPATLAGIGPSGVAFRAGNLYLTDGSRIRKIAPDGTITTVAGLLDPVVHQPIPGFSGDGGPALGAQIRSAMSLDFDAAGNLYIADTGNSCIRKMTARVIGGVAQPLNGTEIITTVAGMCTVAGNSNGTGVATTATLDSPRGIAIDPASGALYIADQNNNNIRKVDGGGTITTYAGTGVPGFQDGPAATAKFNQPTGITVEPTSGDVYVADLLNHRLRRISGGIVTTFAGTGVSSAFGNLNEGGAAIAANVTPVKVRLVSGILYLVDSGIGMVRQININTGIITTNAGSGLPAYAGAFPPIGDGGPALLALLGSGPSGVQDAALDAAGDLFIADASNRRVRFVASAPATIFGQTVAAGNIATIAGPPGIVTFSGDAGSAAAARLFAPGSVAFDPSADLYVSDGGNNRVRRIDTTRTITTVAGNGIAGFVGVPGLATAAEIQPGGLAFDLGNLYLTNNSSRVLDVATNIVEIVTNTAGITTPPSADGTPAANAHFGASSIVSDPAGNLYVADSVNNRIWKVDTTGTVKTVVGGGTVVVDGIIVFSAVATQARLFGPGSLALDPSGNLYTVDGSKNRILKVTAHGLNQPLDGTEAVTIFAGIGSFGFSGDGGLATTADLNGPSGLVFDAAGRLYFNDGANFRIRKIDTTGIITTVAGTGVASFGGDGGLATLAQIRGGPLAFDSFGNLFFSDTVNNVVRVLDNTPPTITYTGNAGIYTAGQTVNITCTALDTGSGIAQTTCQNITGPANSFGLGVHNFSSTATDKAGNTSGGSTSFTVQGADLIVSKTHSPATYIVFDQNDTIAITVTNNGNVASSGTVTVTDTLPVGLTFNGSPTAGWSCNANGSNPVVCNTVNAIASGGGTSALTLNVNVAGSTASPLTNNVAVACTCAESNTGNNTNTDSIPVIQVVNITLATSPTGLQISGDGGVTYFTAPHVFQWIPTSRHTIVTTSPQAPAAGVMDIWLNWSDTGAISHIVTTPSTDYQYTANFQTQYLLTTQLSASAVVGSISPPTGYYVAGTVVTVTATANPGFVFTGFTGALSGTVNPQNLTMNAPETVTANFTGGPTSLSGSLVSRTGPSNARVWQFTIADSGPGGAVAAEMLSLSLRPTSPARAVCNPPITVLSPLPAVAGDLPPHGTGTVKVTIDFSGCPANTLVGGTAVLSGNGGAATGSILIVNQLP